MIEESPGDWRKSSFSGNDSNCVEVAYHRYGSGFAPNESALAGAEVGIRDSKNPAAGYLALPASAFTGLLDLAKHR